MNHEIAETRGGEEIGLSDPISLRIPSSSEYVLLARLVVSQVGQMAGFESEDIYDLKLAVTEAATNVIRHASVERFDIEYRVSPRTVEITVVDEGGGFDAERLTKTPHEQGGFGLTVIQNLVDEMSLESTAGGGTCLKMIRRTTKPV
jgi:serine/threonine-protein kinase RsbW